MKKLAFLLIVLSFISGAVYAAPADGYYYNAKQLANVTVDDTIIGQATDSFVVFTGKSIPEGEVTVAVEISSVMGDSNSLTLELICKDNDGGTWTAQTGVASGDTLAASDFGGTVKILSLSAWDEFYPGSQCDCNVISTPSNDSTVITNASAWIRKVKQDGKGK
jgi:hypothetical protein